MHEYHFISEKPVTSSERVDEVRRIIGRAASDYVQHN